MGMGIISDEDLDRELNNINRVVASIEPLPTKGRGEGDVAVPEILQKIIGETSQIDGRKEAVELAKQFGVSPASVSAYSNGAASTASYNNPSPAIKNHIAAAKERISRKARRVLTNSLNELTSEKLAGVKARDIASIARNMSAIVKDMEPANQNQNENMGPPIVIYAPQVRDERHYEVVYAKEG